MKTAAWNQIMMLSFSFICYYVWSRAN